MYLNYNYDYKINIRSLEKFISIEQRYIRNVTDALEKFI